MARLEVTITGAQGAGKSTLAEAISRILRDGVKGLDFATTPTSDYATVAIFEGDEWVSGALPAKADVIIRCRQS